MIMVMLPATKKLANHMIAKLRFPPVVGSSKTLLSKNISVIKIL